MAITEQSHVTGMPRLPSLSLIGLGVAWAALAAGYLVSAPPLVLAALWAGAAFGLTWWFLAGRAAPGPASVLDLEASALPILAVDAEGQVVRRNGAARDLGLAGADVDAIFAPILSSGASGLYRLARRAEAQGVAHTPLTLDDRAWTLSVEPVAGHTLWRLTPVTADLTPGHAGSDTAPQPGEEGVAIGLDMLPVALVRLATDGTVLFANRAAKKLLHDPDIEGVKLGDLLEGLGKSIHDRLSDTLAGKAQGRSEVARGKTDEVDGFLQVTMTRIDQGGAATIMAVLSDATELKTLEAQFVQSQKMQAVGQLAGGVAHDFNNLLTAISGHCDLLLLRHLQGDSDHPDLMQIRQNTNRAAALVRQLLAFSRKQTLRPETLHLYDTLAELAHLLNRLLGEKVALEIENCADIWPVRADERQLEQVIVNLVVNARDAMPTGGVVRLRTRNETLEAEMERDRASVPPGRYSVIEVEDTGTGIPRDKLGKIFEPFFTTKRVGEGTGLGLSTAYGIIKQMDGFIFVDSTPGEGSIFSIYLPIYEAPPEPVEIDVPAAAAAPPSFKDPTGRGVVLLVEDEAPVRAFAARALQMRGYTVLEADSGEAALDVLADDGLAVDIFVSDVIMPGLDGPSWVRKAYETRPNSSTVFISGYSEDVFSDGKADIPRSSYLAKPFSLNDLVDRVREHMDRYHLEEAPAEA
ncbi:MAG: ATP-binding protein [Pseudomonadota bacterium]